MDLDVVFLGTGARHPSPARGASALVVERGPDHLLVDCGEGTQERLMRSRPGLRHLRGILVTHCHGDHLLGLPGLLATFSDVRDEPLVVAGPPGLAAAVDTFRPWFGELRFPLRVVEAAPGDALDLGGWRVEAVAAAHIVPALAWALREPPLPGHLDPAAARGRGVPEGPLLARLAAGEDVVAPGAGLVRSAEVMGPPRPGRVLVVSGDTAPAPGVAEAAHGADLLIHEATFLAPEAELAAHSGHSTAAQAARLAADAGVRALALTHTSHRYTADRVLAEARPHFPAVMLPADLDAVRIPLPERGAPVLVPCGGAGT
ncbi:MAG: MBL fold metallo-hydrolase [Thermoleophilia bacterium]|nr:MBL fold metallo-hydrolase [Thermoleophilia bacterium]